MSADNGIIVTVHPSDDKSFTFYEYVGDIAYPPKECPKFDTLSLAICEAHEHEFKNAEKGYPTEYGVSVSKRAWDATKREAESQ